MPDGSSGPDRIEEAVRAVLGTLSGAMTVGEAALLSELEALGREVKRAKSEIAALRVDDINHSHIPAATDELDAVVEHTAEATNEILDSCETLEALQATLSGAAAETVAAAVTRIYEACSFQDITGQRITKVVATLKQIDSKVAHIMQAFGERDPSAPAAAPAPAAPPSDADLLNGPQLPTSAMDQSDIDALLASFD